jgi:Protein of unknown function, DUF481
MHTRLVILLLILLTVPLFGRPKTDSIVMKNGDRFTCEVKQLDRGVLYASLDYVDGTISIDWAKVARIDSTQLFLVHTQDGTIYEGILKTPATPADEPVKIEIVGAPQQPEVVERKQVVEMNQASESFWRRFSGSIDSGMIYSRGNNTAQYNLASNLTFRREGWDAGVSYSSNLSNSNRETAATRNQVDFDGIRFIRWNNWYYASLGSFLQSSQQSINLQTSLGGGIGRLFKNTNRTRIALTGGFTWQDTQYASALLYPSEKAVAGLIAGNIQMFIFKKTTLNVDATLFPVLNQPGRVRFNTNASYSIQIIKNLWWKFTFYGNWDNKPPGNLSGSDYGSSSGISYSFN